MQSRSEIDMLLLQTQGAIDTSRVMVAASKHPQELSSLPPKIDFNQASNDRKIIERGKAAIRQSRELLQRVECEIKRPRGETAL